MLQIDKSLKQRLLSGGIWAFVAKAGTGVLTIAATAIVTRILDPGDVGVLFLSFSIIIMMSLVVRLGIDQLGIKLVGEALSARKYHLAKNIVFKITKLTLVSSITLATLVFIFFDSVELYFFSSKRVSTFFNMLFPLWMVLTAIQLLYAEFFRAYHHIRQASIFAGGTVYGGTFVSLFVSIFLLALYATGSRISLDLVIAIILSTTCIFLIIESRMLLKMLRTVDNADSSSIKKDGYIGYVGLVKQGSPFLISSLSAFALIHMDTVILGLYRSEEEVAVYAAATRIVKLILIFSIVAYEVIVPVIVELNAKNQKQKLQTILRIAATMASIPASIILLLFIFYSDFVLGFLYGEYYKEGGIILIVLSIGQFMCVWTGLSGNTLIMLGFQKVLMYIYSAVTIVALLFCVIFAKEYGAISIAYIISIAWVVQKVITLLVAKHLTGMWTHMSLSVSYKALKELLH